MGDVVDMPVITRLNIDPERVLKKAIEHGMRGVVILGYDQEGREVFASSYADGADVLWHLRRAEHNLMRQVDELSDGDD